MKLLHKWPPISCSMTCYIHVAGHAWHAPYPLGPVIFPGRCGISRCSAHEPHTTGQICIDASAPSAGCLHEQGPPSLYIVMPGLGLGRLDGAPSFLYEVHLVGPLDACQLACSCPRQVQPLEGPECCAQEPLSEALHAPCEPACKHSWPLLVDVMHRRDCLLCFPCPVISGSAVQHTVLLLEGSSSECSHVTASH